LKCLAGAAQAISEKLNSQRRDLDAWKHLSASTAMTLEHRLLRPA